MWQKHMSELRERFDKKSSDDLREIWIENDRDQWAGSTFEVIGQILIDRGEEIPLQKKKIPPKQELLKKQEIPEWLKKKRRLKRSAGLLFLIVIAISSLHEYVLRGGTVVTDTFMTGCLIASIIFFIKSLVIKAPKHEAKNNYPLTITEKGDNIKNSSVQDLIEEEVDQSSEARQKLERRATAHALGDGKNQHRDPKRVGFNLLIIIAIMLLTLLFGWLLLRLARPS
jgi:hypothetical protein